MQSLTENALLQVTGGALPGPGGGYEDFFYRFDYLGGYTDLLFAGYGAGGGDRIGNDGISVWDPTPSQDLLSGDSDWFGAP